MAGNRFRDEGVEALYAVWVISCHLLIGIAALCGVWIVDRVIHLLWPGTEPILFGRVPLRMVIETADGGILIVFLGFGLYRVARTVIRSSL